MAAALAVAAGLAMPSAANGWQLSAAALPGIAGTSFEDANADGERDAADSGRAGFVVYIDLDRDGAQDGDEPAAASAADGTWRFDGLLPGTYVVRQAARAGWSCSTSNRCSAEVTVAGGDATVGFGAWRPARILGTVFEDLDQNGARGDGEPVISRRTLYLDTDGDGARDAGEPTAPSGVDGSFSFSGLRPGSWVVREDLPAGWRCSAPSPCAHTVVLSSYDELSALDFGSWRVPILPTPAIGRAMLTGDGGTAIDSEPDPETGVDVYRLTRSASCSPVQVDVPIELSAGAVLSARLVLRSDDGTEKEPVVLADSPPEPADGIWTGTIPCAADAALQLVVDTPAGETTVSLGRIVLVDPSGTVYDEGLYEMQTADGADPQAARCGAALSGATVTLQRRAGREWVAVTPEDRGLSPRVNPQESGDDGTYRWDVSEGEYRVRVTKHGYYPATSRAATVPPAMLDLHVAMTRRPGVPAPPVRECGKPREPQMDSDEDGCVLRPVHARVRGRHIRRVVFYLDGRRLKTVSRADRAGVYGVTVQRGSLRPGKHVLRAKVTFKERAGRETEYLTLRFRRCLAGSAPKTVEATPRPAECATKRFLAWVRGDRIRRVAFRLDGSRLSSVSVADWRGRYGVRVDPAKLAEGRHVVTARIEFVESSGRRPKTVKLVFAKCS